MKRRNGGQLTDQPPDRGDLGRLLDVERRLEAQLAAAREEARQIVAQAEASAREAEAALDGETAGERAKLRQAIEARCAEELDRLAADMRERVAAFRDVPAPRIAELAAFVVDRVVTG